jgi:hypothetical protein
MGPASLSISQQQWKLLSCVPASDTAGALTSASSFFHGTSPEATKLHYLTNNRRNSGGGGSAHTVRVAAIAVSDDVYEPMQAASAAANPSAKIGRGAAVPPAVQEHEAACITKEQQEHALPRNLFSDSDSDVDVPAAPVPATPAATVRSPPQMPWNRGTAPSMWLPVATGHCSSLLDSHTGVLSHTAPPFIPAAAPTTLDTLLAALRTAATIEQLDALLAQHEALIDGECIVAAALRLTFLASGTTHSRFGRVHAVAEYLAALAAARPRGMTTERVVLFLGAFNALGAPYTSPAATSLLHSAAQAVALTPTVPALAVVVHGLRVQPVPEILALATTSAESLLTSSTLQELDAAAVRVCAAALVLGNTFPAAALSVLGHAVCMHVDELSAQELVEVIRAFVAAASTDTPLLKLLAGAFHKRLPVRCSPLFGAICELTCSCLLVPGRRTPAPSTS